jgi:hypothetical protein
MQQWLWVRETRRAVQGVVMHCVSSWAGEEGTGGKGRPARLLSLAGTSPQDVRGSWTLHHDSFKGVTTLRSLLWPGYCFYYNARDLTWGGLYLGSGVRNNDLVFML